MFKPQKIEKWRKEKMTRVQIKKSKHVQILAE